VVRSVREAWERATEDADAVGALGDTRRLFGELSSWQAALVERALRGGATWEDIGAALGTTRQAAWARFRSIAERMEGVEAPPRREVSAINQRVTDELRDMQARLKDFDSRWRERQAELVERARNLERERRDERKRLQQEIRALKASLLGEIRALGEAPE
jgi:hypothetical protein